MGTSAAVPRAATAQHGTFTKNTEPHQNRSSKKPEMMGPAATPTPQNAAQMAMARDRSSGGKSTVMIDSVGGRNSAAPSPMSTRATISSCGERAKAPPIEATPKMKAPVMNTPLRP